MKLRTLLPTRPSVAVETTTEEGEDLEAGLRCCRIEPRERIWVGGGVN
jgi:hypothetical protein